MSSAEVLPVPTFVPSHYQQAVFAWAEDKSATSVEVTVAGGKPKTITAAFTDAVAGSGKSKTLVELSKRLTTKDVLFVAFNRDIVTDLRGKLGRGVQCVTINSLGNSALSKNIKNYNGFCERGFEKYNKILFPLVLNARLTEKKDLYVTVTRLEDFLSKGMAELSDWSDESLTEIQAKFGLEFPKNYSPADTFDIVRQAARIGERQLYQGIVNFDDQIYYAVKLGFTPVQAAFVMVDEAQDLSKAKLELVLMAVKPGGRFLAVGDPNQAIYVFAGADAISVANIITRTNAKVLPLSISYRCAKAIVAHAQQIVPHIEAAPNAPEGVVEWIKEADFFADVKPLDLVMCRLKAPLVSLCIKLLKNKIPARVNGKDIEKQLVACAKEALNGRYSWSQLDLALDNYRSNMADKMMNWPNSEKAIAELNDKVEGVRACVQGFGSTSLENFQRDLAAIFKKKEDKVFVNGKEVKIVQLTTVHSAKGLEAETAYIIEPETLPLTWKGILPSEAEQEDNLDYVARTRAKLRLRYVESSKTQDSFENERAW